MRVRALIFFLTFCFAFSTAISQSPLKGRIICLDPGHGASAATDHYRVGLKGEREEWINLRVAMILKDLLEKKGAIVVMTRSSDSSVDLAPRGQIAVNSKADVFLSIHHNATADRSVNFPIIYFHGACSENKAGVLLAKKLSAAFTKDFYKRKTPVSIASDHTIFPTGGAAVLRSTYGIPGVLAEASFFTNGKEEERLMDTTHNRSEANAYAHALETFFRTISHTKTQTIFAIAEKRIPLEVPPLKVLEEAERMQPEALIWLEDFKKGKMLMHSPDTADQRKALALFRRSARSFPDSYVARECHELSADLLYRLQQFEEASWERIRAREFFVK